VGGPRDLLFIKRFARSVAILHCQLPIRESLHRRQRTREAQSSNNRDPLVYFHRCFSPRSKPSPAIARKLSGSFPLRGIRSRGDSGRMRSQQGCASHPKCSASTTWPRPAWLKTTCCLNHSAPKPAGQLSAPLAVPGNNSRRPPGARHLSLAAGGWGHEPRTSTGAPYARTDPQTSLILGPPSPRQLTPLLSGARARIRPPDSCAATAAGRVPDRPRSVSGFPDPRFRRGRSDSHRA
jgi:hypothetical protein